MVSKVKHMIIEEVQSLLNDNIKNESSGLYVKVRTLTHTHTHSLTHSHTHTHTHTRS